MGEMADYLVDRMIFGSSQTSRRRKTFQSGTGDFNWKLASGEVINMYDMTPEHRENAINICRGRNNSGKLKQLEQVQREMEKVKRHDPTQS